MSSALYQLYELNHAAVAPLRAAAEVNLWWLRHPLNPFAETVTAKTAAAAFDLFESVTRRYGKLEAVHGLSLTVRAGCCYGFFGRNGAGKTTTTNAC